MSGRRPQRMRSRPAGQLTVVLLALVILTGCDSREPRILELKLAHVGAPYSLFALSAEEYARRVNERLPDGVRLVVFGSSQLGSDEVLLQKLKLGTVDLALPSTIMSSVVDQFGLFEMPYLVRDRSHMKRIEESIFWTRLAPAAEARGFKVLAVWENGFRHITNNRRPIETPEDLRGIKLRTPRGRWRVRMFQVLGANPTPMALSEVFVALQTGVMDGQENPFAQIYSSRFHEVQGFLSLSGHVYTPAYLTTGLNRWLALDSKIRSILARTARELQPHVYEIAARMEVDVLERLKEGGLEINEPDRKRFEEASQKVYREFEVSVEGGRELIETALKSVSSQ